MPYTQVIYGEPASKANSRRAVVIGGKPRFIKSKKALDYGKNFISQCEIQAPLFDGPVAVGMRIYYSSRRPDLDESLILDLLQDRVYVNDRQVKAKVIAWGLDKEEPRAEIIVAPLEEVDKVLAFVNLKALGGAGTQPNARTGRP